MTEELKPCWSCGSPEVHKGVDGRPTCDECGASHATADEWNTRALPKVKPLKWSIDECSQKAVWLGFFGKCSQKAACLGVSYRLEDTFDGFVLTASAHNYFKVIYRGASEEKAKITAQADCERHIHAVLETE